jgi:FkbM family methyltransferase
MFRFKDAIDLEIPAIVTADVGAMEEGIPRYAPLVEQGLTTVIGFEPQKEQYAKLCATASSLHQYYPYFLGRGGPAKFHVARYPGCSSIYEVDPNIVDVFSTIGSDHPGDNFHVVEVFDVQTTRLDDLTELPPFDFIKLDVQGAELDVLEGGAETIRRTQVIEAEVEFVPLYKDQPLFGDVQSYLRKQGFLLHKLIDISGRAFKPLVPAEKPYTPFSQMLWADAIFVRDFSDLSRFTNDELIKSAVILHEAYSSIDLVAFLLAELDRRVGGDARSQYVRELAKCDNLELNILNVKEHP